MGALVTRTHSQLLPLWPKAGCTELQPYRDTHHTPLTYMATHLAKPLSCHLHTATHTEPQSSHLPLYTPPRVGINLPLWHTPQTSLRRWLPSPHGPRASLTTLSACAPAHQSCLGRVGPWQEPERPQTQDFPLWARRPASVPLETGVCAVCEAVLHLQRLQRPPAARQVMGC